MIKHIKFGGLYLYMADTKLKPPTGKKRNKAERNLKYLQVARMMAERGISECEVCGAESKLQMHHLFAQSIYPERALEPENTILVCPECHQRIHNDPFLWIDLIKRRTKKTEAIVGNPPYSELLKFDF